jgi:hypothetical protein
LNAAEIQTELDRLRMQWSEAILARDYARAGELSSQIVWYEKALEAACRKLFGANVSQR